MKRVRFEREFWFANDNIISVRAVACWIGQAVNLVPDFESPRGRGTSTEFLDYSGQVPSENEREFMRPEVFHVAFTNFPIDRVHSGRVDSDQNFARLWLRTRRIFVVQDFRSAVVVNSNCFHDEQTNDQRPFGRAWRRAQSGSFVSARPNSRSRPAMSAL